MKQGKDWLIKKFIQHTHDLFLAKLLNYFILFSIFLIGILTIGMSYSLFTEIPFTFSNVVFYSIICILVIFVEYEFINFYKHNNKYIDEIKDKLQTYKQYIKEITKID